MTCGRVIVMLSGIRQAHGLRLAQATVSLPNGAVLSLSKGEAKHLYSLHLVRTLFVLAAADRG